MQCPKCQGKLERTRYRKIEVDRCSTCDGMWLDLQELDQLEDIAFDEDDLKGSTIAQSQPTDHKCPHCATPLQRFDYRFYSVQLEYCENGHGYWLDDDEEKRILELMDKREEDMERKFKAEAEWEDFLRRLKHPTFFDKLRMLFFD
jgi:Zn-finger nucleic acid-binding protein